MLVRVRDSVTGSLGHLVSWEWDNVHYVNNTDNDRKEGRYIFKLSNSENKCSPFVFFSHILRLRKPLDLRSDFYDLQMLQRCANMCLTYSCSFQNVCRKIVSLTWWCVRIMIISTDRQGASWIMMAKIIKWRYSFLLASLHLWLYLMAGLPLYLYLYLVACCIRQHE